MKCLGLNCNFVAEYDFSVFKFVILFLCSSHYSSADFIRATSHDVTRDNLKVYGRTQHIPRAKHLDAAVSRAVQAGATNYKGTHNDKIVPQKFLGVFEITKNWQNFNATLLNKYGRKKTATHRRQKRQVNEVRIRNGRTPLEGRVEVEVDGEWGSVCSDHWTTLEARVVCRQTGHGLSRLAVRENVYVGTVMKFVAAGVKCTGDEESLSQCQHDKLGESTHCPNKELVAGVICAHELPDLVPNATLVQQSVYLQDVPLFFLQCAMEENCVAQTAQQIVKTQSDWFLRRRRLMRFSLSTWNFGTAPFYPASRPEAWQWHACHMHYHSMQRFADYELRDMTGKMVAAGHKASFCLEDVRCMPGKSPAFRCEGLQAQGISVGCADDYNHDIDCQWIDVTDILPGLYVFKVRVNPLFTVGELDYSNNAVICKLYYSGTTVNIQRCILA